MISAKIICDSITEYGNRLTTFELRYPKFIHQEFLTHRNYSRNASSSRAIPTKKYIEEVSNSELRALPIHWGVNKAGMQANEELSPEAISLVEQIWESAALSMVNYAKLLAHLKVHKQTVNRIMEPFLHINVVCTATEYANFFGLRLHKDAQPEIRYLAEQMWEEYKNSTPKLLSYVKGEWHLPYVFNAPDEQELVNLPIEVQIKISVARCARVSYKSFNTNKISSVDEDLSLYEKLLGQQPIHASPAEHQATPDVQIIDNSQFGGYQIMKWQHPDKWGNFRGWQQYRKFIPNENILDLPSK